VSTRRAVQIAKNVVALRAAALAANGNSVVEDAFYAAARFSVPDAAWGRAPASGKVFAAHQAAWNVAHLATRSPLRRILTEPDPVRRIGLALWSRVEGVDAGQVIADSWSGLPRVARLATASVFMPRISERTDLPAATIEPIAHEYSLLAQREQVQLTVSRGGQDWKRTILGQDLASLNRKTRRGRELTNAAIVLMQAEERFVFDDLVRAYDHAHAVAEDAGRGEAPPPSAKETA
jgi:hypothetical protein